MTTYRVEVVRWEGTEDGPGALEDQLNAWAAEGWDLSFMVPTLADTSIRALMGAASAGTTEIAVILSRDDG